MKKHAPRDDDSGRVLCGSKSGLVDAAFPNCKRCLRAIASCLRKESVIEEVRLREEPNR